MVEIASFLNKPYFSLLELLVYSIKILSIFMSNGNLLEYVDLKLYNHTIIKIMVSHFNIKSINCLF